jgi:hypothetical protein
MSGQDASRFSNEVVAGVASIIDLLAASALGQMDCFCKYGCCACNDFDLVRFR